MQTWLDARSSVSQRGSDLKSLVERRKRRRIITRAPDIGVGDIGLLLKRFNRLRETKPRLPNKTRYAVLHHPGIFDSEYIERNRSDVLLLCGGLQEPLPHRRCRIVSERFAVLGHEGVEIDD